jgi:hypothetical protein
VPIGTVPISVIVGRRIGDLDARAVLEGLEHQARQGVDYFTIHAGVLREHLPFVKNRLIGIVSRGGSLLAKWMLHHGRQNLMYVLWDEICEILRRYDVTFSIGDGLRPGGLADATDRAQLAELETLGELTERAWRRGCQVMIEGPGHVPFDQIEFNMKPKGPATARRSTCSGHSSPTSSRATTTSRAASAPRRPPTAHDAPLRDAGSTLGLRQDDVKAGRDRLQDRRARRRRRARDPRHARPRRRFHQGARRAELGEALRLSWDPDPARHTTTSTSTPTSARCAGTTGARADQQGDQRVVSGKGGEFAWAPPVVSAALTAGNSRSERRGCSRRRRSTGSRVDTSRDGRRPPRELSQRVASDADALGSGARARPGHARASGAPGP